MLYLAIGMYLVTFDLVNGLEQILGREGLRNSFFLFTMALSIRVCRVVYCVSVHTFTCAMDVV